MAWNDLNIQQKAELMKLYVSNGITDLDTIKQHYNSFADGGPTNKKSSSVTNGVTVNGTDYFPISETEALEHEGKVQPNDLHAPSLMLKPVTIKAPHPIRKWDTTIDIDDPDFKQLYQHYLNREQAGKDYMKWAAPLAMSPLVPITGPLLGEAWNAASNVALQGSKNALTTAGKMMLPSTWATAAGLSSGIGTAADAAMFSGMAVNAGRDLLDKDNWIESGKYNNDNWGGWQGGANLLLDLAMTAPVTRAVKGGVGLVNDAANTVRSLKPVYLTPKKGYAYRRIDNSGFQDLMKSGLVRPNQQGVFARDGHIQSGTWFNLDFPARGGGNIKYPGDYVIEIAPEHPQFPTKTTPGTESLGYRLGDMQIDASSPYIKVYHKGKLIPRSKYPTLDQTYQEAMNPILADVSYKSASFNNDLFAKMIYSDYISGKEASYLPSQKSIQIGLDNEAIQLLKNRTLNRDIKAIEEDPTLGFLGENRIKKLNEIFDKDLPNIKVGKYSGSDYKNAGYEDWGGFYNTESQFISINKDSGMPIEKIQAHEGLHHIDSKHSLTIEQDAALSKAFDSDFNTLPETEYAPEYLKGYTHMHEERITTNRDARDELLGYEDIPLEKQNQIIDQATDDEIFNAVESANGYGRAYIKRLRAEGKLTHEKANAFRDSMKKVGVVTGIIGTGAVITNKK